MSKVLSRSGPILTLLASLVTGLYINVLSEKIYSGESWDRIFLRMGWWNLLAILWILLLMAVVYQAITESRKRSKSIHLLTKSIENHFDTLQGRLVRVLFELLVRSTNFPIKKRKFNMHIFVHERMDGKDCLRKEREFFFEQEVMPKNYPLDVVRVNEDDLVICDAFKRGVCIYEELPSDHMRRYRPELEEKVDPNIRWVFACPVTIYGEEAQPVAIICCFGRTQYFRSETEVEHFERLLHLLSQVIGYLLQFHTQLEGISERAPYQEIEGSSSVDGYWL